MSDRNLLLLRSELIKKTKEMFGIDIINNIYIEDRHIVLESDLYFDWFAEGIIIYLPKYDQKNDKNSSSYISQGYSSLYDDKVKLYIRSDYHDIITNCIKRYVVDDCESEDTQESNTLHTSFVISYYLPRS